MIYPNELKNDCRNIEDVKKENAMLDKKLRNKGVNLGPADLKNPLSYNRLLKHIIECEEIDTPMNTVRSFFSPDFQFPPDEQMGDLELEDKIDEILTVLEQNHVEIGLAEDLPNRLVYQYIRNEVLPSTVNVSSESIRFEIFNGCTGSCGECFQKDYCEISQEAQEGI